MKRASFAVLASLAATAAAAQMGAAPSPAPVTVTRAVAVLHPAKDGKVGGVLTFVKGATGGIKVTGRITGLSAGTHGFHIHEFGDCSAPDFNSAGGHFNPTGQPHAGPPAARHIGDMGNVEAGTDNAATVDYTDAHLHFEGPTGILGRGVIVHANPDDFKTQPTGNAGGRAACGVIGVAKAE